MKGLLLLGAAVTLLKSVTAFLPNNNDHQDVQNQLVFQPAKGTNKAVKHHAASTKDVEAGITPPRFGADAPLEYNIKSPDSEHTQSTDDIDLLPQQGPKFPIGTTTSQWAVTYTPYTDSLTCLPPSTIRSDIASIARKGFTTIRLYSIDCSILRHMEPALLAHGLKLIVGIALDDGLDSAQTQISELIAWATDDPTSNPTDTNNNNNTAPNNNNKWALIELILIGSDAIFSSHTTAPTLASLLTSTRLQLRSNSYAGPISTTEPLTILTQHAPLLCPTLDLPASTIQPYFHPRVRASDAGNYVSRSLSQLSSLCPELRQESAIALDTGWPSRGRENGEAVAGYLEQWIAVVGIMEEEKDGGKVGGRSVFLGWEDEGWRDGGEFGVEGSWGCGHVFGEGEE